MAESDFGMIIEKPGFMGVPDDQVPPQYRNDGKSLKVLAPTTYGPTAASWRGNVLGAKAIFEKNAADTTARLGVVADLGPTKTAWLGNIAAGSARADADRRLENLDGHLNAIFEAEVDDPASQEAFRAELRKRVAVPRDAVPHEPTSHFPPDIAELLREDDRQIEYDQPRDFNLGVPGEGLTGNTEAPQ